MGKRFLIGVLSCLAGMPVAGVWAKELWDRPDAVEMQALPPYCKAKLDRDKEGSKLYAPKFGSDWEHIQGCIAGEANHTEDKQWERTLDRVYRRIEEGCYFPGRWGS